MTTNYTITIAATVHARYADGHEAHTDAESIATHIREECGNVVDDVRVVSVEADGDGREE